MAYKYLSADRASANESEAKGMAGCIASESGSIYLYIPPGRVRWAHWLVNLLNDVIEHKT